MIDSYRFGPLITSNNVTFRLWAPGAREVDLVLDGPRRMQRVEDGWHTLRVAGVRPGMRYRFRIDSELDVPDPASRFQPEDVHGPSEVVDQAYDWKTRNWKGRLWHECVFLELHTGTFTPQGTFRGVVKKLDHIAQTGITAIELMPVADFSGRWNWGYDGVLLFAADSSYGRPQDLKLLIDEAHRRGLMVFLDVVYNHFGPEGNYLGRYAPQFFSDEHTPWGHAIDYEKSTVRRFAVENALYWLHDFRFDGLRLDAVHAISEPSRSALLNEMSAAVGALAADTGRHIHLVLENDANQVTLLDPLTDPPCGKYRAQWNDDYHHAFHVLLTGEQQGYYSDYPDSRRRVVRSLAEGFAYQGEPSPHRDGHKRGEATKHLPATAFVNFLQNHDQIGNRPFGERLTVLASRGAVDAALAITLLSPSPPLLFMGEEWGAREPFPFFCDFKGDLAEAVRTGRRKEFAEAYEKQGTEIPDPLAEETLRLARLNWASRDEPDHKRRLALVRDLLSARKEFVIPRLPQLLTRPGSATFCDGILQARWNFRNGDALSLLANLSDEPRPSPVVNPARPVWGTTPGAQLPAWFVYLAIESD
jgi:maltooligosyltrehalose trehalohydrolase